MMYKNLLKVKAKKIFSVTLALFLNRKFPNSCRPLSPFKAFFIFKIVQIIGKRRRLRNPGSATEVQFHLKSLVAWAKLKNEFGTYRSYVNEKRVLISIPVFCLRAEPGYEPLFMLHCTIHRHKQQLHTAGSMFTSMALSEWKKWQQAKTRIPGFFKFWSACSTHDCSYSPSCQNKIKGKNVEHV